MEQRDFFLSYTHKDEAWAVWAADVLKKNGYTVYVQALDIKSASFLKKMEQYLDNSYNLIAVWSEDYFQSDYAMDEWRGAYYAVKEGEMNALIPILISADKYIPRLYRPIIRVDLSGRGRDTESEELMMSIVRDALQHDDEVKEAVKPNASAPVPTVSESDTSAVGDFVLTHKAGKSEIKYGFILLGTSRNLGLGQEVSVRCGEGKPVLKRMHKSTEGRLDGLTKIYRDNGIQTGTLLRVSYDSGKRLLTIQKE